MIGRREFITLLGGAAAWPIAAQAEQQPERTRRIGVLMNLAADDAESQRRMKAFVQQLQDLKWIDGRNVQLETRWGAGDADRIRRYAAELVALGPDVILAVGSTTTGPLLQATRTIPVVFAQVIDPVGGGFVESLARPGAPGNFLGGLARCVRGGNVIALDSAPTSPRCGGFKGSEYGEHPFPRLVN